MRQQSHVATSLVLFGLLCGLLTGCGGAKSSIVGNWIDAQGNTATVLDDGQCTGMYYVDGSPLDIGGGMTCSYSNNTLVVTQPPNQVTYEVRLDGDTLTLSAEGQTITLNRLGSDAAAEATIDDPLGSTVAPEDTTEEVELPEWSLGAPTPTVCPASINTNPSGEYVPLTIDQINSAVSSPLPEGGCGVVFVQPDSEMIIGTVYYFNVEASTGNAIDEWAASLTPTALADLAAEGYTRLPDSLTGRQFSGGTLVEERTAQGNPNAIPHWNLGDEYFQTGFGYAQVNLVFDAGTFQAP